MKEQKFSSEIEKVTVIEIKKKWKGQVSSVSSSITILYYIFEYSSKYICLLCKSTVKYSLKPDDRSLLSCFFFLTKWTSCDDSIQLNVSIGASFYCPRWHCRSPTEWIHDRNLPVWPSKSLKVTHMALLCWYNYYIRPSLSFSLSLTRFFFLFSWNSKEEILRETERARREEVTAWMDLCTAKAPVSVCPRWWMREPDWVSTPKEFLPKQTCFQPWLWKRERERERERKREKREREYVAVLMRSADSIFSCIMLSQHT